MVERRQIRLDDRDLVAGAQILAWIALPHRPEHGVELLNHWFWQRRRFRGESVPDLPFELKKINRIQTQLRQFHKSCLYAFTAGDWYNWKLMSGPRKPPNWKIDVSIREMASRRAVRRGTEVCNEMRDIWSRRKPIAHLALAAGNELGRRLINEGIEGFDLERAVFHPDWVSDAIASSEEWVRSGVGSGAFKAGQLFRFHRDTF